MYSTSLEVELTGYFLVLRDAADMGFKWNVNSVAVSSPVSGCVLRQSDWKASQKSQIAWLLNQCWVFWSYPPLRSFFSFLTYSFSLKMARLVSRRSRGGRTWLGLSAVFSCLWTRGYVAGRMTWSPWKLTVQKPCLCGALSCVVVFVLKQACCEVPWKHSGWVYVGQ